MILHVTRENWYGCVEHCGLDPHERSALRGAFKAMLELPDAWPASLSRESFEALSAKVQAINLEGVRYRLVFIPYSGTGAYGELVLEL